MSANGHIGFTNGTQDAPIDSESDNGAELVSRHGPSGRMNGVSNGVSNGSHNGARDSTDRTSDFVTTYVSQDRAISIRDALLSGERSIERQMRPVTGSHVAQSIWAAWVDDNFAKVAQLIRQSEDYRPFERPFECLTASEVFGSDYRLFDLVLTQDPAKRTVYYIKVQASGVVDLCISSNEGVSIPPAPASRSASPPTARPPRPPRIDMSWNPRTDTS